MVDYYFGDPIDRVEQSRELLGNYLIKPMRD
jgi:hypothetical protein